jgi:energy-coupling factor transport system ATP-binding protein
VLQTGADIILLDEPVTGLDPVIKEKLGELLRELCREGKTVILVTHDLDFAGKYCDYCVFLSEGKIAAQGERFPFFSTLRFYTTSIARKTNSKAVSDEDFYER